MLEAHVELSEVQFFCCAGHVLTQEKHVRQMFV